MTGVIQRAALAICHLNSDFKAATGWIQRIWRADRADYERLMLDRLNEHLRSFAERGLLELPAGVALPLADVTQLARLPAISRQQLRELFPVLRERYAGDRRYVFFETGGTTAEPVHLYRPKTTAGREVASTSLMLRILGWRPGMVRVGLWGSNRDLGLAEYTRGFRAALNRALMLVVLKGTFRPRAEVFLDFLDTVAKHRGCAVYGFACLLDDCSRLMLKRGLCLAPGAISALWTTAETVTDDMRKRIAAAFGVAPGDFYGARECPAIMSTCQHGRRHINPRYIIESIVPPGGGAAADCDGELAITDLFNSATPVIRYLLGDSGQVSWEACPCGRNGAVLTSFGGRASEFIPLKSGTRRSTIWFPHTMRYGQVHRAQLVKTGEAEFEVRYTGSGELRDSDDRKVCEVLAGMLEGAHVRTRLVDELTLTPQGKCPLFCDETRV